MHIALYHRGPIILCVIVVLVLGGVQTSSATWDQPTLVTSWDLPLLARVKTDGTFVAWSTNSGGASSAGSAGAMHITSGEIVAAGGVRNGLMDLDDGILVRAYTYGYQTFPETAFGVFAMNLNTREEFVVTPARYVTDVSISDGIVVWQEYDLNGAPSGYRLLPFDATTDPLLVPQYDPYLEQTNVVVDSGEVFWQERVPESGEPRHVVRWQIGDDALSIVEEVSAPFSVHNGTMYYSLGGHLNARNLGTGDVSVYDPGYVVESPGVTDGRYMFWSGYELTGEPGHIIGYDMQTRSTFVAVTVDLPDDDPASHVGGMSIANGKLAWGVWDSWGYEMGSEVYVADLKDRLPTAYRPAPDIWNPGMTYFSETGHYLSWGFRDYWTDNGGLPVFGYPLSEEFAETNADSGYPLTAQFTERQRFEWHPDNAGTPYEVLLGRLGAEQARDLKLLDTEPFRYRTDREGPDAGCLYFRETGHYACDYFRFYWQEHGLDFGDNGVSFRESLALFGYPLSEPFMTTNADGHTVLTQYFERAVLERHPENPDPYKMLLRRLGAELLVEREWLVLNP
jgi:hypothetical protein